MKLNDFINAQLEIEARATPGPWRFEHSVYAFNHQTYIQQNPDNNTAFVISGVKACGNGQFAANARSHYRPLLLALKEVRETLGLMAEGEGSDAEVYQEMARGALATIETLLLAHAQEGEKK
jgi:hypothetical protein